MFRPKLFDTLKTLTPRQLAKDCLAGVIVGVVAVPLAIAFAIASGVSPEKGLITGVVGGFIISALGGSRVQIGGPTGAFVVIVYSIIRQYGVDGLLVATLMAGVILVIFGFTKLGSIIKFMPHSVIMGFTIGIACIIFTGQVSDFFGFGIKNLPADFIGKLSALYHHAGDINPVALGMALLTVGILWVTQRITRAIPGSMIALVVTSALTAYFNLPIETIGSRFGVIPHTWPAPSLPAIDFRTVLKLINPAFTIALLGAIESLLSAVVADGMIGTRHRSNMELIAQGVANIASPLFGGIPATGAIARTATNIKNGGRTPIAGLVHALTLLVIMLFFGKLIGYVPMACLAGILMMVAYHMSEWRSVVSLLTVSRGSALVTSVTFALTVLVDLTTAIEIGLILSMFAFIRNMSLQTSVSLLDSFKAEEDEPDTAAMDAHLVIPRGVVLYEINGPLFFGAVYKLKEALAELKAPKVLLLKMDRVPVIDSSGVQALKESLKRLRRDHTQFVISGLHQSLQEKLERANFTAIVDSTNFCPTLTEALARAKDLLQSV